ncbi:MAG: hypothetical protein EPN93_09630 [Spirochaetes bacterium]|nr:MAG: hypothetical protein EPN93_09630 [Spirochaetota bacterium]
MGIIQGVLEEEYKRLQTLAEKYIQEISALPAGSLSVKNISGHRYAYIAKRVGGKIHFKYLGKESTPEVEKLRRRIAERRGLQAKLKTIKNDLAEIERAIGGRKI